MMYEYSGSMLFIFRSNHPADPVIIQWSVHCDVTVTSDTTITEITDVRMMKIGDNVCMDNNVSLTYVTPSHVDVVIGSASNLFLNAASNDTENQVCEIGTD